MIINDGGGRSSYSTPLISISPTVQSPSTYVNQHMYEQNVKRDQTLEDLIKEIEMKYPQTRYTDRWGGDNAMRVYYDNLIYQRDHPPLPRGDKQDEPDNIMDSVLDAIFYASAIASIIPYPPFAIGGRIGLLASNAGRAVSRGQYYAGARYIDQISRTVNRELRYYRKSSKTFSSKTK